MPQISAISREGEKSMKKKNTTERKIREKSFFVPRTIAAVAPKMTIECSDRYELLISGCKNIDEYSKESVTVSTFSCKVKVLGTSLSISFLGDGKILLSGRISSVEFI